MPLLKTGRQWSQQAWAWSGFRSAKADHPPAWNEVGASGIACARRGCQLLRASPASIRETVFYEGRDVCSRACLLELIAANIEGAFDARFAQIEAYNHRIPLGLLMLSRKLITHEQLTHALSCQRDAGQGRIGEWLVLTGAVQEDAVARAVAAQWGIPMLLARSQSTDVVGLVPILLTDAFNSIPVRIVASRILYLAVENQLHPSLNLAIERMTGFRVEPVVLTASDYRLLHLSTRQSTLTHGRFFRTHSANHLCTSILSLVDADSCSNLQIAVLGKYVWLRLLKRGVEGSEAKTEDIVFVCQRSSLNS